MQRTDALLDWDERVPWSRPVRALAALGVVTALLLVLAGLYVRRRWCNLFETATRNAFAKTDVDGSGRIDRNELYTGVLEMYLTLHLYGINVQAPSRSQVLKLMEACDDDGSGEIDRQEFTRIMTVLVQQTFGRIVAQVGLTVLCPVSASFVSAGMHLALQWVMSALQLRVPPSVEAFGGYLPTTLDETLICGVLMLSINPALALVDAFTEEHARQRGAPVIRNTRH